MTYVRWFGTVFGAIGVIMEDAWPSSNYEILAWALVAALLVGNIAIWGSMGRISTVSEQARLGAAVFAFDALLLMAIVWLFAFEDPYITWGLLLIIPMEGALRYGMRGALGGAGAVMLFFIPQSLRVADLHDAAFDYNTYVFVVGLAFLLAGVTGTMSNSWRDQRVAFEAQSVKLADIDRLKDRFLAVTSHEIRGPLTAIIAGVDTLRKRAERLKPEQSQRMLDMITLQAEQLGRLVDDLTVTSQIQAQKLTLQTEWAELKLVIDHALEAAAAKRRSHRLEVFVEPVQCEIDTLRVGQIVRNLVENAYKYTLDETRVAVTAKGEDGGIAIEVADSGEGIPVDKRHQLFEAFTRIEETAAGQEGVGLGLYVVSQLVSAMDGRIDLASASKGTTFTIHIPCGTQKSLAGPLGLVRDENQA